MNRSRSGTMGRARRRAGFSVLEVLVVLAVFGILASIGALSVRAPSSRLAANDFKALLQEARIEAVKRNRAVAVVWDPDEEVILVRATTTSGVIDCGATAAELARLDLAQYRDVAVDTDMASNAVAWLPTGRSRTCSGGLSGSLTTFTSRSSAHAVTISVAGQVQIGTP